jgi:hypothetical protein
MLKKAIWPMTRISNRISNCNLVSVDSILALAQLMLKVLQAILLLLNLKEA